MKRGITVLLSLCVLVTGAYFTASNWAIRHETIKFYDPARDNRLVAVDVAVRRDKEMQANAGMITLPVAILNHGNTAKNTDYLFLANAFAARGYLVISPQHDLPTDPPMATEVGELYVGRLPQIQRGVANIHFTVEEMKKIQPNADYGKVTMVGHSMGGDISMYFAKQYPDEIKKVVTLDNLRVPFLTGANSRSLRSAPKIRSSKLIQTSFRTKSSARTPGLRLCKPPSSTMTCAILARTRPRTRSRACWINSWSTPTASFRRSIQGTRRRPRFSTPVRSRRTYRSHQCELTPASHASIEASRQSHRRLRFGSGQMSALRHSDGAPSTSGLPRQVQSPSACLITCPNLFPRFVHEPSEVFRRPYDVTSAGRHNSAQLETGLCKQACEFVAGPLSPAGCDKRRVTTNPPGKQTSSVSLIAVLGLSSLRRT
jgi:pimeloyl-ACP methyl ester carboxylesterase